MNGTSSVALALGDSDERQVTLASWAHGVRRSGQAEVVYVPIGPGWATATVRDVLTLAVGLLRPSADAPLGSPAGTDELFEALGLMLQGVGWVSSMPRDGDEQVLVVLDGVDVLADGTVHDLIDLTALGEGARVVLGSEVAIEGVADGPIITLDTAAPPEPPGTDYLALRDLLACALAPISEADLGSVMRGNPCVTMPAGPVLGLTRDERGWRWEREQGRRQWLRKRATEAMEDRLVEEGLSQQAGSGPVASYFVAYLGAHLMRRRRGGSAFAPLVTQRWFEAWSCQPGWVTGFLGDVALTRRAAARALVDAGASGEDRADVTDLDTLLRAVLVNASIVSKLETQGRPPGPFAPVDTFDGSIATGADADRRRALATLVQALDDDGLRAGFAQVSDGAVEPARSPAVVSAAPPPPSAPLLDLAPTRLAMVLSSSAPPSIDGVDRARLVDRLDDVEGPMRVTALAAVANQLPSAERPPIVARAVDAYWAFGDEDTQRALIDLAPFMTLRDATELLVDLLAGPAGSTLSERLTGWGGIIDLIPLLRRIGGDEALVAAIRAISDVAAWLP